MIAYCWRGEAGMCHMLLTAETMGKGILVESHPGLSRLYAASSNFSSGKSVENV